MTGVRVAINGFGTIGKRVAKAVQAQPDMIVSGVTKTGPSHGCALAERFGVPLYCTDDSPERIMSFDGTEYSVSGGLSDLLSVSDIVIDCAPGKMGQKNHHRYLEAGIKHIFQGGEKHGLTGMSYTSCSNHLQNLDVMGTRVVSCNTTGLARTLVPLREVVGEMQVECTMIRRAADPGDSNKGPVNAIKPVLKVPSHHGPDLMTVAEKIDITSLAVAVPTTIMHVHAIVAKLPSGHGLTTADVLSIWEKTPRVISMSGSLDGIPSTAEVMEMARDIGRPWGDLHEIFLWSDGVSLDGDVLRYFQAIHQESDVVPENVDAVRALMDIERDWRVSVDITDRSIKESFS